ncbi:nuclear transport factor 2 family protein [Flavitalea sp.]|nr:nuclear transport factor 2 family protein [Flavitalea sp.]
MKSAFLSAVLFLFIISANAQNAEDSVKASVNQLFEGMKNVDPELIRNSFADSAVLQTIVRSQDGKVTIKNESVAAFASSISKQTRGALDEQIQFESVKIDGDLASVWTPYKFYFSGKLSHCGVNSFQLVRTKGVWKIQYLIDTRRRTGCE